MQESNFNNKKQRRFISRKDLKEFQLYLEKNLWKEIKFFSEKYNLSQSDVVRCLIVSGLSNCYVKEKFEELKK